MKKLGLIINPIAGMGGSVGLKGTDNVLAEAIRRGALPQAAGKVTRALAQLSPLSDKLTLFTAASFMGENVLAETGFHYRVVYTPTSSNTAGESHTPTASHPDVTPNTQTASHPDVTPNTQVASHPDATSNTTATDTISAARIMADLGAGMIVFAGGDGTARNIYDAVGESIPVLGIPAGVKIHSPVYAKTPEKAGELLSLYLSEQTTLTKETEVLDINEDDYRKDIINTQLYGYLKVPFERRFMQGGKAPSPLSEKSQQLSIAAAIAEEMENDTYYFVGPGSTPRTLMEYLQTPNTLLGVDIVLNKQVVYQDVSEQEILKRIAEKPAKLIITPTGGQGYLLGRGNQQISPQVIKRLGKKNIIVTATPAKLAGLFGQALLVDTGDPEADKLLHGHAKVVTGYHEFVMCRVE